MRVPPGVCVLKVKLGCPRYCEGWVCVDKYPESNGVVASDIYEYMRRSREHYGVAEEIFAKNVFEHLSDAGTFLSLCYNFLVDGGRLTIITDNALWFPYYVPVPKKWNSFRKDGLWGVACHTNSYPRNTPHYGIYTLTHLSNLLELYGFKQRSGEYGVFPEWVKWFNLGVLHRFPLMPRLKVVATK